MLLRASYASDGIDQTLRLIGMSDLANEMKIFQVISQRNGTDQSWYVPMNTSELELLIWPYEQLESIFQTQLPSAWLALETPCFVFEYLRQELLGM